MGSSSWPWTGPLFPSGATAQCDGLADWFDRGPLHADYVLEPANILAEHWYYSNDGVHVSELGDSGGGCTVQVGGQPMLVSIHESTRSDGTSIDVLASIFKSWVNATIPPYDRALVTLHPTIAQAHETLDYGAPGEWAPQNVLDGTQSTAYSSSQSPNGANVNGDWLATWWGPGPFMLSQLNLGGRVDPTTRMVNAFPANYRVFVTTPDNSAWAELGAFTGQPLIQNGYTVSIGLDTPIQTWGVLIYPDAFGTDTNGTHYFQMGEVSYQ